MVEAIRTNQVVVDSISDLHRQVDSHSDNLSNKHLDSGLDHQSLLLLLLSDQHQHLEVVEQVVDSHLVNQVEWDNQHNHLLPLDHNSQQDHFSELHHNPLDHCSDHLHRHNPLLDSSVNQLVKVDSHSVSLHPIRPSVQLVSLDNPPFHLLHPLSELLSAVHQLLRVDSLSVNLLLHNHPPLDSVSLNQYPLHHLLDSHLVDLLLPLVLHLLLHLLLNPLICLVEHSNNHKQIC